MRAEDVRRKFPDLEVGAQPPRLFRINGCGLGFYFSRDEDRETRTYVKTLYVSFLFIPLIPISAWRVADARGGGYLVYGREPRGAALKRLHLATAAGVFLLLAIAAWRIYLSTDMHLDAVELDRARDDVAAGRLRDAVHRAAPLVRARRGSADDARLVLREAALAAGSGSGARDVVSALLGSRGNAIDGGDLVPDLWARAVAAASGPGERTIEARVSLLEELAELAPSQDALAKARTDLLETAVKETPPDLWAVSELALVIEARGDAAAAEALLVPQEGRLGSSEGARVLGQVRAAQGRIDDAVRLLSPYVSARLAGFREEAERFDAAVKAAQSGAIREMEHGGQSAAWRARYDAAGDDERRRMVVAAVQGRLENDAELAAARARYVAASRVVPVAMDLAIARMQRGRGLRDAAAGRRELEEAERIFKAIEGAAGGDAAFEVAAGRVSFWLGKRDECERHLAAAVAASGASFAAHAEVAATWASLGETESARGAWEAAYAAAKNSEETSVAAQSVSATLAADPDAALAWIRKADASQPAVRAARSACEARVALRRGDLAGAERALAASLAAYDELPRSPVTLNNAALVAADLSSVTGRADALEEAGRRLRVALAEMPTNLVVLANAASALSALGWVRAIGGSPDLRVGVASLFAASYDTAAERAPLRAAARESDEVREALRLYERGLGLSPGNADLVHAYGTLCDDLGDTARLRDLATAAARTPPDTEGGRLAYLANCDAYRDAAPTRAVVRTLTERLGTLDPRAPVLTRVTVEVAFLTAAAQLVLVAGEGDLDALDARARRLHSEHPSSATRGVERTTAALLVHRALVAADARFASESQRTAALAGVEGLLCEALRRDGALRDRARALPAFQRLVGLAEASAAKFPGELGPLSRALLSLAGRTADAPPPSDTPDWALDDLVAHAAAPYSPRLAVGRAWSLRLTGRAEEADAVLRGCVSLGGRVPYAE